MPEVGTPPPHSLDKPHGPVDSINNNISDNSFPFPEQASENLVKINYHEVLDIASCFRDNLEGIPINQCWGKNKQKA